MTAGNYKGRHYTQWVDTVKQLKREKRGAEAMVLLQNLITAVELEARSSGFSMPSWYHEQLAILLRQAKDYTAEIDVLEGFQRHPLHVGNENAVLFQKRIEAAKALRAKTLSSEAPSNVVALTPAIERSFINSGVARRLFEMGASAPDVGEAIASVTSRQGGVAPTDESLFLEVASTLQRRALAERDYMKAAGIHRHHAIFLADAGLD